MLTPNHSTLGGVWVINVRYIESAMLLTTLLVAQYLNTASTSDAVLVVESGRWRLYQRVDSSR